jgi:hypothetical protein
VAGASAQRRSPESVDDQDDRLRDRGESEFVVAAEYRIPATWQNIGKAQPVCFRGR